MVQIAYKGPPLPPNPPGPCPVCNTIPEPEPLNCHCDKWEGPDIDCVIVNVMCKQFASTININLGENFNGNIQLNSGLINQIYHAIRLSNNNGVIPGAVQMAIFLEEGLQVSANGTRKPGSTPSNSDGSQGASAV